MDPQDENHEFIVQVWTNEGLRIFESAVGAALPQIAVLGFTDVQARGGTYRVFAADALAGHPGGAEHGRAPQHGAHRRRCARWRRWSSWRCCWRWPYGGACAARSRPWNVCAANWPSARRTTFAGERPSCPTRCSRWWPNSTCRLSACSAPLTRSSTCARRRARAALTPGRAAPAAAGPAARRRRRRARAAAVERLSAGIDRATRLVEQLLALAR